MRRRSEEVSPFDEWIIGEGVEAPGRWYIWHTRDPMFCVEVGDSLDLNAGLSWSLANGQTATRLAWWGVDLPPQREIDEWVFRAGRALLDYEQRMDRRIANDRRRLADIEGTDPFGVECVDDEDVDDEYRQRH